jgi:dienelactone hydrolase
MQPELLRLDSGARVQTPGDWSRRRAELRGLLDLVYGALPEAPTATHGEVLHRASLKSHDARLHGATLLTVRIRCEGSEAPAFSLQLWLPQGDGPFPVILTGDGCWYYATDEVKARLLARGYALAQFNRVELAPDPEVPDAAVRPEHGWASHGALAVWAWGYHRCVDVLQARSDALRVRPDQIVVVGHSRGGKAALLAGAADERIALTSANNSGAAGAGSFQVLGQGAEALADVVQAFPHWFGPRLAAFAGRESELPLDMHCLLALVAPRALLTTEARDDLWANPEGTHYTHQVARQAYALLGAADCLALRVRDGGHAHLPGDWLALLDFADARLRGAVSAPV